MASSCTDFISDESVDAKNRLPFLEKLCAVARLSKILALSKQSILDYRPPKYVPNGEESRFGAVHRLHTTNAHIVSSLSLRPAGRSRCLGRPSLAAASDGAH